MKYISLEDFKKTRSHDEVGDDTPEEEAREARDWAKGSKKEAVKKEQSSGQVVKVRGASTKGTKQAKGTKHRGASKLQGASHGGAMVAACPTHGPEKMVCITCHCARAASVAGALHHHAQAGRQGGRPPKGWTIERVPDGWQAVSETGMVLPLAPARAEARASATEAAREGTT